MADKTAFDYVNEIWSIANYVRDVIRPADYNKLILPFGVIGQNVCPLRLFTVGAQRACGTRSRRFPNRIPQVLCRFDCACWRPMRIIRPLDHLSA